MKKRTAWLNAHCEKPKWYEYEDTKTLKEIVSTHRKQGDTITYALLHTTNISFDFETYIQNDVFSIEKDITN